MKIELKSKTIDSKHTLEELRHRILVLHQMMQGVPEERVDLADFNSKNKPKITCGTNACLLGWAAFYPPAQAWGIYPHAADGWPAFRDLATGEPITASTYRTADRILWEDCFSALFSSNGIGEWDARFYKQNGNQRLTDKALALARLSYAYNKFLVPA